MRFQNIEIGKAVIVGNISKSSNVQDAQCEQFVQNELSLLSYVSTMLVKIQQYYCHIVHRPIVRQVTVLLLLT